MNRKEKTTELIRKALEENDFTTIHGIQNIIAEEQDRIKETLNEIDEILNILQNTK